MDVAIVGGGVSGAYCAYRLAKTKSHWDVALFEASDRFGGRLWSAPIRDGAVPAELGGMFLSDKHHNAYRLAVEELGLELQPVRWSQRHQYLRDAYLDNKSYASAPEAIPFKLSPAEKGKHPIALLLFALDQIAPAFDDLWPLNMKASPEATYRRLRAIRHKGQPLYASGFWNVLSDVISNEAYTLLLSTIGYGSVFRNANALEAIWTLLRNMDRSQNYFSIEGGYQRLPLTLLERASARVDIRSGWRLKSVKREDSAFRLGFATGYGESDICAEKVILALPRRALELIAFDETLFEDAGAFARVLNTVTPAPACKLFLTFEEAWWDRSIAGPSALEAGAVSVAFTDLPMRQCYYYGASKNADGPSLLMGAYTDDVATGFWSGLAAAEDDSFSNPCRRERDQQALWCSKSMVGAACKQLRAMHHDVAVPDPSGALFVDWGRDPFGAGWHDWAPNIKSWKMGPRLRRPNPALDLYICGEAYSQRQSWVEGAVNSAEMVMRSLGLEPPAWVDPGFVFEREGELDMSNPLRELLLALSESLGLQRAYGRDREAIMTAFGLSDAEKAALRSGEEKAIKGLAGGAEVFNTIIISGGGR